MSHISVSHYTLKRQSAIKSSKFTTPFENTRYTLFTPVKLLEDRLMKYTNSDNLYCLKESEDSYTYFTKDGNVQRTLMLDDIICFMHLFWELFDLSILPPLRYIHSGSFISVKTINNLYSYVNINIYCEFPFHTTCRLRTQANRHSNATIIHLFQKDSVVKFKLAIKVNQTNSEFIVN